MIMSSKANSKAPSSDSYLPKGFTPGEHDVVIGRSLKYYNHSGNIALRNIVDSRLEEYTNAEKSEKSFIISEVTDLISSRSKTGDGFLKLDPTSNRWYKVGEYQAREHVSQRFRDALGNYRSSSQSKKTRRKTERAMALAEAQMRSAKRMRFSSDFPALPPRNVSPQQFAMAVSPKSIMAPPASPPMSESVLDAFASLLPPNYQADPDPLEPVHFPELEPLPLWNEHPSCQNLLGSGGNVSNPTSSFLAPQQGKEEELGLDFYFPNITHATSA